MHKLGKGFTLQLIMLLQGVVHYYQAAEILEWLLGFPFGLQQCTSQLFSACIDQHLALIWGLLIIKMISCQACAAIPIGIAGFSDVCSNCRSAMHLHAHTNIKCVCMGSGAQCVL